MGRSAEEWGEDFEERPVRTSAKAIAYIVIGIIVIFVAVWGLGVLFSWWGGQGDAIKQKNSAQNWIAAQRAFHTELNTLTADQNNIALAKKNLADFKQQNPQPVSDPIAETQWSQQEQGLQVTLAGLQQGCQTTVSNYNTDSQSYLTQDWKDAGLPATVDASQYCN